MIYLFCGSDRKRSADTMSVTANAMKQKRKGAEVHYVEGTNLSKDNIEALSFGGGLFESKYIIIVKDLLDTIKNREELEEVIQIMQKSEHPFLLLEGMMSQNDKKLFDGKAEKIYSYDQNEQKAKFDSFKLARAYTGHRWKDLWQYFMDGLSVGESAEAMHGIIFWQIKTLLISTKNAKEESELRADIKNLVSIYHESRLSGVSLALTMERWILSH